MKQYWIVKPTIDRIQNKVAKLIGIVLLILFAIPSYAQTTMETVPPIHLWCSIQYPIGGCLYPTDLAAAQAFAYDWNMRFNTSPTSSAYFQIDGCDGHGYCWWFEGPLGSKGCPGCGDGLTYFIQDSTPICPIPTAYPTIEYHWNLSIHMCYRYIPSNSFTITLSGGSSVEPWNARHDPSHQTSNIAFKAIVAQSDGLAAANIPVTITTSATKDSGGHIDDYHNQPRPPGRLSSASGTMCGTATLCGNTDSNGVFSFTFGAEEAAGKHTLSATCQGCTGSAEPAIIFVKVPGLMPIPELPQYWMLDEPDPSNPGAMKSIGGTNAHKDNHNLTGKALAELFSLAYAYKVQVSHGQVLYLNDASLPWGGLLDDDGNWLPPHQSHRLGNAIDIRAESAANLAGAIPHELFSGVQNINVRGVEPQIHCYKPSGTIVITRAANPNACDRFKIGRHFHVIFR